MLLYSEIDDNNLFNLLSQLFKVALALDDARYPTARNSIVNLSTYLDLIPEAAPLVQYHSNWERSANGEINLITRAARDLVSKYAKEKYNRTFTYNDALKIVLNDIVNGDYYFNSSNQTLTLTPDTSNTGDQAILFTNNNAFNRNNFLYPEKLILTVAGDVVNFKGEIREEKNSAMWPGGSGLNTSINIFNTSLLGDAFFTDGDVWIIREGDVEYTPVEVQTVEIANATGGWYTLLFDNQETEVLSYDATADTIQIALRKLHGLENVIVTGTNPFTITFNETRGDISELTSINGLTGISPTITHSTTTQGNALSYRGNSIIFNGDGTTTTTIFQKINLNPSSIYAFSLRAKKSTGATGVLDIELRNSIDGSNLLDYSGNQNKISTNLLDISDTTHTNITGIFRTPEDVPVSTVFTITTSSPISDTGQLSLDEVLLQPMVSLYPNGLFFAGFTGRDKPESDKYELTVTNDTAGLWEFLFDRFMDIRIIDARGLPVFGTNLIPDSLLT